MDGLVKVIIAFLREQQGHWEGTAQQLLDGLLPVAEREGVDTSTKSWPRNCRTVGKMLRRRRERLWASAVLVDFHRDSAPGRKRVIRLQLLAPVRQGEKSPEKSHTTRDTPQTPAETPNQRSSPPIPGHPCLLLLPVVVLGCVFTNSVCAVAGQANATSKLLRARAPASGHRARKTRPVNPPRAFLVQGEMRPVSCLHRVTLETISFSLYMPGIPAMYMYIVVVVVVVSNSFSRKKMQAFAGLILFQTA